MNIGVIGVGNMGRNHLRVYSELRWVDRVYYYDSDPVKLTQISGKFEDCTPCESMQELLKKVDAVSVCVPTEKHFEVVKVCLEQGVNVLVEKPVVANLKEGEELLKIHSKSELILGVGHIERFNPIIREATKLLDNPRYVEIKRHNPASARVTTSSVIDDLMIHDIDIVWNIFFNGRANYEIHPYGDYNFCMVVAVFDKNIVFLSASRLSPRKIRTIYIEGDGFSVEGNFMDQEVYVYKKPSKYSVEDDKYIQENVIEKVLINKIEPLKEELKQFVTSVKTGKPFPVTLEQALLNLKIVEVIKNKLQTSNSRC
ncbi:MAG: Gfo/Idh/MocA family oxidoreductase [Candidatus Odinarchaeum yellowstonii]|uniref:Gfo/Idh/MocA family oxidoreductase n=1 Tax=Odinarchaeota yellowstonii (strain LCB_4) TaxID=1841599 RepID=A0AAF0D195_ODILC|nr:MAG: Gfo/Idh/MocA family oxidoreductase [Candidatus Odinarchaeum yellowstonii]